MSRDDICYHCGHLHKPTNAELLALLLEIVGTALFTVHDLIPHPSLRNLFSAVSPKGLGNRLRYIAKRSLDCDGLSVVREGDDSRHGAIWRILRVTTV
jgi:hypothetical protein